MIVNKVCSEAETDTEENEDLAGRRKSNERLTMYTRRVIRGPREGRSQAQERTRVRDAEIWMSLKVYARRKSELRCAKLVHSELMYRV